MKKAAIFSLTISGAVMYFANQGFVLGKLISNILPCTTEVGSHAPCYGAYNVVIMIIAFIIFAASLIWLVGTFLIWAVPLVFKKNNHEEN